MEPTAAAASDAGVSEQAVVLGTRRSMVGVLAQPAGGSVTPGLPMVVLLNAGVIHRVGPNRMNVALARSLARQGYTVLRFDLSGIGDSAAREDALSPFDAALADVREVLDFLESTRGPLRVVLVGLCSGANQAVFYSGRDPRVVGAVLIDPSVPRTRRYFVNHYSRRVLRASSWVNVLRGRHAMFKVLGKKEDAASEAPLAEADESVIDTAEGRAMLERAYQAAVDNGVRLLAVCTADLESRINYREQLLEALPNVRFGSQLRLEWFADADHTFTLEAQRSQLLGLVVGWVTSEWPRGEAAPG